MFKQIAVHLIGKPGWGVFEEFSNDGAVWTPTPRPLAISGSASEASSVAGEFARVERLSYVTAHDRCANNCAAHPERCSLLWERANALLGRAADSVR